MPTVITDGGKKVIIDALNGVAPSHVGWGTGEGTTSEEDTSLFTEASEDRVDGTNSVITTSVTDDTYQVVAEMIADGTKTVTNAGLFTASTEGDLVFKTDFDGVPLEENDKIEFTFKIQQTSA